MDSNIRVSSRRRLSRRRRPSRLLEFGCAAALVLTALACRGSSVAEGGFEIDLSVSPTPPAVGPARLTIRVTDPEGMIVDQALVLVQGTMSHPGMTPTTVTARPTGDGRFAVEAFDFSMAGDWILNVAVGLPDGRSAQRDFPMRAVGAPDDPDGS